MRTGVKSTRFTHKFWCSGDVTTKIMVRGGAGCFMTRAVVALRCHFFFARRSPTSTPQKVTA